MSYGQLDPVIIGWGKRHKVPLAKVYKEGEVRSFELGAADGTRFQLWINQPNAVGEVKPCLSDHGARLVSRTTDIANFEPCLEALWQIAMAWIDARNRELGKPGNPYKY